MFEKEAEERAKDYTDNEKRQVAYECGFLDGVDFGYNKANEWHFVKDGISRNERLSSQEQQELYEWIESAMGFGENLDECEEKLTEAKELLKRWVDDKVYTVSEQKDLIADTEQFLKEVEI